MGKSIFVRCYLDKGCAKGGGKIVSAVEEGIQELELP